MVAVLAARMLLSVGNAYSFMTRSSPRVETSLNFSTTATRRSVAMQCAWSAPLYVNLEGFDSHYCLGCLRPKMLSPLCLAKALSIQRGVFLDCIFTCGKRCYPVETLTLLRVARLQQSQRWKRTRRQASCSLAATRRRHLNEARSHKLDVAGGSILFARARRDCELFRRH